MSVATEQITLSVPDVSCAHCVASVDEALSGLDGVGSVTTDLGSKQVRVSLDPARVTVDRLVAALDEAGYPATPQSAS
jgi:copper chaperone